MTDYRQSHADKGPTYDQELEANAFDAYMHHWEARHLERLISLCFPQAVPRYLDFACGTGRITAVVAPMAEEVLGVDISESMLKKARQKVSAATFVQADLTKGNHALKLGSFDLVTAFRFFGNAQPDLRVAALAALNPLQPMGGYLVANNHRNPNGLATLFARARGDVPDMDLTHGRFKELLREAGYRIVATRPIGVWKYRASLMMSAETNPQRDKTLERLFRLPALAPIAPDVVVAAKKVEEWPGVDR